MPDHFPKISVITAVYNQAAYIEDCILSVIGQGYPDLEYIVIDGGSTDGTTDIIKKYEDKIHYWVSEKDRGLYHALHKGLSLATGEIMGWLNSDDILHRKSLFTIAEIFSQHQEVKWLQGYPTTIEDAGRIVFHRPPCYSRYFFYLKEYHSGIFIQQESTYWRRDLWEASGAQISTDYKYAGDFELWMRFFNHAELYITQSMIGAFRVRRQGQLSKDNYQAYIAECDSIVDVVLKGLPPKELALLRRVRLGNRIKRRFPLFTRGFFDRWTDHRTAPRRIDFDFDKSVFKS